MYTHNLDQHNLLEKFTVWDTRNQQKYRNLTDDERQVSESLNKVLFFSISYEA